jgi:hypothetical protein
MKRQKSQQLTLTQKESIARDLCHNMDTAAELVSFSVFMHAHTVVCMQTLVMSAKYCTYMNQHTTVR